MDQPTTNTTNILVENHRQFLAFLEQRVESPDDAEDILQTAFLKSIEKGHSIQNNESVIAWFYRLLRNALVDYYRHRAAEDRALHRAEIDSLVIEETDLAIEKAVCQCVINLLSTLKEDYASLIRRIDLEEVSISEVAAETGMTPNNVRVKLHRARVALRREVELSCGTCAEHGCLDCMCGKPLRHNR